VSAVHDLEELIRSMEPELVDGEFVFVSAKPGQLVENAVAMVLEAEGTSYVLARDEAVRQGLGFGFVAGWITLRVPSALSAVGLTAVVSAALAKAGISCKVIAGYHHDHLLVPYERRQDSLAVRRSLAP
jgi:hypothetical protein